MTSLTHVFSVKHIPNNLTGRKCCNLSFNNSWVLSTMSSNGRSPKRPVAMSLDYTDRNITRSILYTSLLSVNRIIGNRLIYRTIVRILTTGGRSVCLAIFTTVKLLFSNMANSLWFLGIPSCLSFVISLAEYSSVTCTKKNILRSK